MKSALTENTPFVGRGKKEGLCSLLEDQVSQLPGTWGLMRWPGPWGEGHMPSGCLEQVAVRGRRPHSCTASLTPGPVLEPAATQG